MKLLLIGYSRIAQRRVLPALAQANLVHMDVASRTRAASVTLPAGITGRVFDDYETALAESQADLVYVSTVNSTHAAWAEKALQRGCHVVVDKPACTSLKDTGRLVELARRQRCCLAEATVYPYHPQVQAMRLAFREAHSQPTRLVAILSFPPLPAGNFRYQKALGGGALWDLGPYAVTPGRLFFGAEPEEVFCRITGWGDEVETDFSVLATYGGGRAMVGHFGFHTGYCNRLDLLGPGVTLTVDRVFTTSPDLASQVHVNQHDQPRTITIAPADSFACFLRTVVAAIEAGQFESLADDMLSDARVLDRMRKASLEDEGTDADHRLVLPERVRSRKG